MRKVIASIVLVPIDGAPLPVFRAGQFVALRLLVDPDKPPTLSSYSLSDLPRTDHFRISGTSESNGIGSSFLRNRVREGDVLDVSAPRGSFTPHPGQNPVVLLSAGVGATPVISMLHALTAEKSGREIWWIYEARKASNTYSRKNPVFYSSNSLTDEAFSYTAGPPRPTNWSWISMPLDLLMQLC